MKLRVLVVDDEPMVRTLIIRALKWSGMADFEFKEASDGEEAAQAFMESPYDLLLVDWHIPKLTGPELCNRLRNTPEGKDVPIVMITSESAIGSMMIAADMGKVNAFISKPFTTDDFRHKIQPLIDEIEVRHKEQETKAQQAASQGVLGRLFGGSSK